MTSKEKIDLLLQVTGAKISLPKISHVRERGADGRMTDVPKISGSVELSLFPESDLLMFRSMIQKELMTLLPFEAPKQEEKENPAQLALPLDNVEEEQQSTKG